MDSPVTFKVEAASALLEGLEAESTIAYALFRLQELSGGSIIIDGIDSRQCPYLSCGEENGLSIITQEPVIFSGVLRSTLDPFGDYSDEELWKALERASLSGVVESLDVTVEEGGTNFSKGQWSGLLCFARSLLSQPRILVMDEATAACDYESDMAVQEMVRSCFPNTTLLIISHRLDTIIDADSILVMSDGAAVEYGSPAELLSKDNGEFKKLVESTGEQQGGCLREAAFANVKKD